MLASIVFFRLIGWLIMYLFFFVLSSPMRFTSPLISSQAFLQPSAWAGLTWAAISVILLWSLCMKMGSSKMVSFMCGRSLPFVGLTRTVLTSTTLWSISTWLRDWKKSPGGPSSYCTSSSAGTYIWSIRDQHSPPLITWCAVKIGAFPETARATSTRLFLSTASRRSSAPWLGYGDVAVLFRSSVTSGTQLASMPRTVVFFSLLVRLRRNVGRSAGMAGAYAATMCRSLCSTFMVTAM